MTFIWMSTSFCYYLIQFQLSKFPSGVYLSSAIFSITGVAGFILAPVILNCLGIKMSFFSLFLLQAVSGTLIVFWGEAPTAAVWVFPFLVLFASFGTACCFCMIYAVHGEIFSTLFAATAIGICNFFARVATIFAPEVA